MLKDMDRDTIDKKVNQIIADRLNIDLQKIKPESKLVEDLGMDSFGAVEVIFDLENEFELDISNEEMRNMHQIKEIVDYIVNHK